jgi:hypothetical protein
MTTTANAKLYGRRRPEVVLHQGEPPVDHDAQAQAKAITFYQLGILTPEAIALRDMLFASGLLSKQEEEQVEKATGAIMSILEEKYNAVMEADDRQKGDNSKFFIQSKKPTSRAQRRRAYFSRHLRKENTINQKAPQSAPGARTIDDYLENTRRFRQQKLEENMNDE